MLPAIFLIVAGVLLALFIVICKQPAEFTIRRSATLPASPAVIFPHVNDLHLWEAWSPWKKKDPNAISTYSGAPYGPGASMAWAGNKQVGEGRMTIMDSRPNEMVGIKLEFFKPFKATNTAQFNFKEENGGTLVTWRMSGTNNFIGKLFSLMVDCDKMVGSDFEQGLANLRDVTAKN